MATPTTTEQFLDVVRKSLTVAPKRLDDYLASLSGAEGSGDDPRRLAARLVRVGLLTSFQAEQLLLGKWRGFTLGKYRILERLGAGGMGAVFLCEHAVMHHRVAIKVLPAEKANDAAALGRFYREARAAAGLDHPNIVRAYDIDRDGDRHFLVMEFVDGASLHELVSRRGPLDPLRAAHYIRQAALGLQRAHEAGLVHRDVKPGNLLVDRAGTIKVADLGLARFFHDDADAITREHAAGAILGSADYFAPEQAVDSHEVDIRGDIYALGCTLYFLMTGRPPFEGGTVTQKLLWHQIRAPQPVRELRPEVPEGLAAVLERMLAKKPAERFPTPAAVVRALEPWTATPLAPPPEADFRRLSPAAEGFGETRGELGSSGTKVAYPPIPESPRASPSDPDFSPAPEASAEDFSWDRLDTTISYRPRPAEPAHTGGKPSSRRLTTARVERPFPVPSRRGALVMAVAVIGIGLMAVGLWRALTHRTRPDGTIPPGAAAAGKPAKTAGGAARLAAGSIRLLRTAFDKEERHESLWAALGKAEPGDRIIVEAETLEESLLVRGDGRLGHDVSIEGRTVSGRPVLWHPPAIHGADQPLVAVDNVPGLRLTGFILDGQGRVRDLVVLSERCPRLTLDGVQLRGFARSAVRLYNCEGEPFCPVSLRGLSATTEKEAETALLFESGDGKLNQHVEVRDGRFVGPYRAAVRIAGSLAHARFLGNRFFRGTHAFHFVKSDPPPRNHLALANNTFAEFETGLHWEAPPDGGPLSHLAVRDNLFVRTKTLAATEMVPKPGAEPWPRVLAAAGNVRDAGAEGNPSLSARLLPVSLPADPANDSEFLSYPPDSPLASAGVEHGPTGVPPHGASSAPAVVVLLRGDGQEHVCASVREALRQAKPRERVVVRGDVLEENLVLWGRDGFARDVHLEGVSAAGRPVLWRVPHGHPANRPLVRLTDLPGLTVKGFLFDGRDRVEDLVVLGGYSPGTVLEDIHLRGFRRHGLVLRDCTGLPDQPVAVRRVRTSTLLGSETALAFQAEPGQVNQFLHVQDCRFEGPYQTAVRLGAPAADLVLERNRFYRGANGIVYTKAEPRHRLHATFEANTFYDVRRILHLETAPAADNESQLVLRNNLFVRPERLAEVDGLALEPDKCAASWVWFPEEGDLLQKAPAGTRYFRKTFELPKEQADVAMLNIICDDAFTVWLNGKEVAKGQFSLHRRQVYAFDVAKQLQPGRNVLAVAGTNLQLGAGLLVQLNVRVGVKDQEIVSDGAWLSAPEAAPGWQAPDFADAAWLPARVVRRYDNTHPPWRRLVWDWLPQRQAGQVLWPLAHASSAGNVSCDGVGLYFDYTILEVADGGSAAALRTDPTDDATFLRYQRDHALARAGANKAPAGVPPVH